MTVAKKPAATKSPPPHPLYVLRRAQSQFGVERVICYTSCGKDSVATLSLLVKHLGVENIRPVFMYLVPNLSYQETYLSYLERLFNVEILRAPHWMNSLLYRGASFRHPTKAQGMRKISIGHVDEWLRRKFGPQFRWITSGEKSCDSLERNAQIRSCDGINEKRGRIYPLAYWGQGGVFAHLKRERIALPSDYSNTMHSGSSNGLWHREVGWIKERHPEDYAKICRYFPLLPAQILRHQIREKAKAEASNPAIQNSDLTVSATSA